MIFFSRVTYLAKLELLRGLVGEYNDTDQNLARNELDFFYLGPPHSNPVTPTGTIGVALKEDFLLRNVDRLSWGFFGDSGAILTGRRKGLGKECAQRARLDTAKLLKIFDVLRSTPRERMNNIVNGMPDTDFLKEISDLLDPELYENTLGSSKPLDWRIEVALKPGYFVAVSDVIALALPNTYKYSPDILKYIGRVPKERVLFFNPKLESPHSCIASIL